MTRLSDLTTLVRSKNAGPFTLTFDVMFSNPDHYNRVKRSGALNAESVGLLYRCDTAKVRFFACDNILAFKFSIPRPLPSGELGDGDLHGGQQYAPLLNIEIT